MLAPQNVQAGDTITSGADAAIRPGNTLPLSAMPIGQQVASTLLPPSTSFYGIGARVRKSEGLASWARKDHFVTVNGMKAML